MWTDSYYPYISGVTRSVATTKQTLSSMNHDVSVFCPSYPDATYEEGVYRFQSIKAPTKPDFYVAIPTNPKHLITLNEISPEIIHIHSPFNLGKMGLRMGTLLDIPVVFTYHSLYNMFSHYIPIIGHMTSELIESRALITARRVDALIAPSTAIRDYLLEQNIETQIFVIPTGVDVDRFRHGNPQYIQNTFNIPAQLPILLSVGRLNQEKNPETLLKSFSLAQKRKDCFLVMVGDGPMRKTLNQLAKDLNIDHRIIFTGKVPPHIMPHMYASSDIFLFSSVIDTQGLVIVEAKSAGVPCVAIGALGVKDMVENKVDGFLCENDPEDIADKTLILLNNRELLSRMKRNALVNSDKFSLEHSCAKLVNCYTSITHSKNMAMSKISRHEGH